MAAKQTSGYANNLLKLIFNGTAFANVADNAGSSPITNLSVALHTASPGATGSLTTSEATYTSYARVNVTRTSGGWTVTGNSVSPAATIVFPASTGGSETITNWSVGIPSTNTLLYYGSVSPSIVISGSGITPELVTTSAITEV